MCRLLGANDAENRFRSRNRRRKTAASAQGQFPDRHVDDKGAAGPMGRAGRLLRLGASRGAGSPGRNPRDADILDADIALSIGCENALKFEQTC
jgi:hypothetical protein